MHHAQLQILNATSVTMNNDKHSATSLQGWHEIKVHISLLS